MDKSDKKDYDREYYQRNKEKIIAYSLRYYANNREKILKDTHEKRTRDGYSARKYERIRKNKPTSIMFHSAKSRAKESGVPFEIVMADIAIRDVCPIFGIPLRMGHPLGDDTATLDRFVPELGYVKGNICVISMKANRIKNNATLDDIQKIADWMTSKNY